MKGSALFSIFALIIVIYCENFLPYILKIKYVSNLVLTFANGQNVNNTSDRVRHLLRNN